MSAKSSQFLQGQKSTEHRSRPVPLKVVHFIVFFNFEWHGQNEVGNIAILVLWRDCEKLYTLRNNEAHRLNFHNERLTLFKFWEIL